MRQAVYALVVREPVFIISIMAAALSSCFCHPDWQAIDWKVIIALFNLMTVIVALEKYHVLDIISLSLVSRVNRLRYLSLSLVLVTGIMAMFVTNDVALLTMVPLTVLISKRCRFNPAWIVIYQTLAANLGSSLTPMGNPQNLFLYEFYHIGNLEFMVTLVPLVVLGFGALGLMLLMVPSKTVYYNQGMVGPSLLSASRQNGGRRMIYGLFFGLVVLSILRFIDYRAVFAATLVLVFCLDKDILLKVDYFLLGTFVAFFIFVDNISRLPAINGAISGLLAGEGSTFLWGALASQVISNVPAAVLLANFSANYRELLWGVNVGGMGTIIASLASLISFKIYSKEYPASGYLAKFHLINLGVFIFLSAVFYPLSRYH